MSTSSSIFLKEITANWGKNRGKFYFLPFEHEPTKNKKKKCFNLIFKKIKKKNQSYDELEQVWIIVSFIQLGKPSMVAISSRAE